MLCTNCKTNNAQFHYKQIMGGIKTEHHLCAECAQALGFMTNTESFFDIGSILSDFISAPKQTSHTKDTLRCEKCATDYNEFRRTGLAGCDRCYETFASVIENSLSQIQSATTHKGKCSSAGDDSKKEPPATDELTLLKEELARTIEEERYEDAAVLRDKIKKMEGEING